MVKKIFALLTLISLVGMTVSYTATVESDDYNIPVDNQGKFPADVNLVGVDKHVIGATATGSVAKNASVTTLVSTTTANPCLLYGLIISSNISTGYDASSDYVVIRDTYVVNTTQNEDFVIMFSSSNSKVSGSDSGQTWTWYPPAPIKFNYGICATNSDTDFTTTLLFRYLKR